MPYPPNYGGVIDVFYKIRSLHQLGVKIILHCFEYGRGKHPELEEYCEKVYYYKRKNSKQYLLHQLPYIVISRQSDELVQNLMKDDYPILFEGLHCCYHLNDERLAKKKKIVRTHNIEHEYYEHLASVEKEILKRLYFTAESKKLRKFEKIIGQAHHIAAISKADAKALSGRYYNVTEVPAFHPNEKVEIETGLGEFVLYHGNLEIGENNTAALFLVNEVFKGIGVPLIIAGNKPSAELKQAVKKKDHIHLRGNISTDEIHRLIREAHINILPTFQSTGIKLKLLSALFTGRFCMVNSSMVQQTGLEKLCIIRNTAEEMKQELSDLFHKKFTVEMVRERKQVLEERFSNKVNAEKIIQFL